MFNTSFTVAERERAWDGGRCGLGSVVSDSYLNSLVARFIGEKKNCSLGGFLSDNWGPRRAPAETA